MSVAWLNVADTVLEATLESWASTPSVSPVPSVTAHVVCDDREDVAA